LGKKFCSTKTKLLFELIKVLDSATESPLPLGGKCDFKNIGFEFDFGGPCDIKVTYKCTICNVEIEVFEQRHSYNNFNVCRRVSCGALDWGEEARPENGFEYYMYRGNNFFNHIYYEFRENRPGKAYPEHRGIDINCGEVPCAIADCEVENCTTPHWQYLHKLDCIKDVPIYAQGVGVITHIRSFPDTGNIVIIEYANGLTARYSHLGKVYFQESDFKEIIFLENKIKGIMVDHTIQIGETGKTGMASMIDPPPWYHLHFDVYITVDNPERIINPPPDEIRRNPKDIDFFPTGTFTNTSFCSCMKYP